MVLTNHAVTNRHASHSSCISLRQSKKYPLGRGEWALRLITYGGPWENSLFFHTWVHETSVEVFLRVNKPHKRLTSLPLFALLRRRLNRLGHCCHCLGFGKGSSVRGARDVGTARSRGTERGGHLNRHKSAADPHQESGSSSFGSDAMMMLRLSQDIQGCVL